MRRSRLIYLALLAMLGAVVYSQRDFWTPIDFHGKVIDQNGDPVVDAKVKLAVNDKANGGHPSTYTRKTDAAGRFSIAGIRGLGRRAGVAPGYVWLRGFAPPAR